MNFVNDLPGLIQLLHNREENIIFPIGAEGQQLLDFLHYGNFLHRVCCIAATEVDGGIAQRSIHEVPIIPFENLVHFRETATLIVAVPNETQLNLRFNTLLENFGFKYIFFINEDTYAQIRDELQKMYTSGFVTMWYMRHFEEKFFDLKYQIEEQNAICDVNMKAFSEYKNAFRGKEVVIVAGGPTIKYYTPIPNAIHIGLNFAWKREDIPLDYLFAGDNIINKPDRQVEQGFSKIRKKIFICKSRSGVHHEWIYFPEHRNVASDKIVHFYAAINKDDQFIHPDIRYHGIVDFWTGTITIIHFSLFAYAKKIYLVGCDTSPTGHFYKVSNKEQVQHNAVIHYDMKHWKVGYARMKMFAKHYYPDTEIISINPVGLRGLFKDVYTEEYQTALDKEKIV